MSKLTGILKRMEWSGRAECAPYCMGGPSPYSLPACPCCRGVQPSDRAKGEFIPEAIGHKPDCEFNQLVSGVERLEKLIEAAYREGWEDAEDYALAGPNMRGSVHARVDAAWLASTARQGVIPPVGE